MRRISDWANIKESGTFERLAPGGYIVKILNVKDFPEKEYLKISFDIAEGEKKGFFKKSFDNDTRDAKKWPNGGSFIRSYKQTAAGMFKGFVSAVEASNKGYTFDFEEQTLVGKVVGVVVGDEEFFNQKGQVRTRTYVNAIRSVDAIKSGDYKIPELKKLDASKVTTAAATTSSAPFVDPFANGPSLALAKTEETKTVDEFFTDEELPF